MSISIVSRVDDFEANTEWDYLPGLKITWYNYTDRTVKLILISGNNLTTGAPVTWIAFGNAGLVATSIDGGETWVDKTSNLTGTAWGTSNIVVGTDTYSGEGIGQFIIVNDSGLIATTTNFGDTWTTINYVTDSNSRINWSLISLDLLNIAVNLPQNATYTVLNEIPVGETYKRGDLNQSGSVTGADSLTALKFQDGLSTPTEYTETHLINFLLANQSLYPAYLLPGGWYSEAPEIKVNPDLNKQVSSIKFLKETNQLIIGGAFGQLAVAPVNSVTKLVTWGETVYYYPKLPFDRGQREIIPFRYQAITSICYSNVGGTNYYIFGTNYGRVWITTTFGLSNLNWFLYTFLENEDLELRKNFNRYQYQRYLYLTDINYTDKGFVTDILPIKVGINTYISYLFKYKDNYILRLLFPDKQFLKLNSVYKNLESFIVQPTKLSNIESEPSIYSMDIPKKLLINTNIFTELRNVLDINIQSYYDNSFTENLEIDSAYEEKNWPSTTQIENFQVIPYKIDAGSGLFTVNYVGIAQGAASAILDSTSTNQVSAGGGELQKRLVVSKSSLTSFDVQKSPYLINSFAFDSDPIKSVIVGESGLVEYSTNMQTWTYYNPGFENYNLIKVIWSESLTKFIAVGSSGKIFSSVDGTAWTELQSPTTNTLNGITQLDSNTFIAVGEGGTIIKSIDGGATWSIKSSWTTYTLYSVSYNSGYNKLVAVGASGRNGYSLDQGETWIANSLPAGVNVRLNDITNNGGLTWIIAANSGRIFRSIDGISWTEVIIENGSYYRVKFINARFVVTGFRGRVYDSTDNGINWTDRRISIGNDLVDFTFYNNKYYFYTRTKSVFTNDINWTAWSVEPSVQGYDIRKVENKPGTNNFYFIGSSTQVWRSQDNGDTWSIINSLASGADLIYDSSDDSLLIPSGKYIYKILLSTLVRSNSTNALNTSLTNNFTSITKFNPVSIPYSYIACTGSNEIATNNATTVSTWTKVTLSITGKLNKVIYVSPDTGEDLLIGIGTNVDGTRGVIFKSTDGTNWTEDISYEGVVFDDIIYTGNPENAYIVVGNSGIILYSKNSINWIPVNKFTNFNIITIKVLSGGIILAAGDSGFITTSTNLKTWSTIDSKVAVSNFKTIGYSSTSGKIVIAGDPSGVILTN